MRIISIGIVSLLLVGSIFATWWTFSRPTDRQETVTRVNYQHSGEFDYEVYAKYSTLYGVPPEPEEPNPVYYTNIIDSIDVSFSYEFVPQGAVTGVTEEVQIIALMEDPGTWEKEIVLVPQTTKSGKFTLDFPLDVEALNELSNTIEKEIGATTTSADVTITAYVHVVAQTDSGVVEDDFVQTTKTVLTASTLEWEKGLSLSQDGSYEGLEYQHHGDFDYAIHLKENTLYGAITLTPPQPPEPQLPVLLPEGRTYFPKTIDSIEVSFSYDFDCDQRLSQASATVEVTAVLQYPQFWAKTFVLIPLTTKTQDFTVNFPLDIDQLYEFEDAMREEIGMGAASYDLIINADVHMLGKTDFGTIDEVFSQSLSNTLGLTTLSWGSDLDRSQSGSITEAITIPNSVWPARGGALGGLILVVLVSGYVVGRYAFAKRVPLTAIEAEAQQAKRKHKDVIVDIQELPEAKAEDRVILLDSLDELIKAADALLKPVLHKAEAEKHTYCVIDASSRYEYVAKL